MLQLLTVSIQGKTHTVYVPPAMVPEVREWIASHKRMQRILKEVSILNMAIIHRACARKPGRRQGPARRLENPVELLFKTVRHFLPGFSRQMNALPDQRRKEQSIYSQAHLLCDKITMQHLRISKELCQKTGRVAP